MAIQGSALHLALVSTVGFAMTACGGGGGLVAAGGGAPNVVAAKPTANRTLMVYIPAGNTDAITGRSAVNGNDIDVVELADGSIATATVGGTLSNGVAPGSTGAMVGDAGNGGGLNAYDNDDATLTSTPSPLGDATFGLVVIGDANGVAVGGYHAGDATPVGDVPTNVTASYAGTFQGLEVRTGGNGAGSQVLVGAMNMNANFGAGTVDGTVTSMVAAGDNGIAAANYGLAMNGTIDGNAYSGTTSFINNGGGAAGAVTNSAMNGAFYGANAGLTAGAVRVEGTTPMGNNAAVIGAFGGSRQ